VLLSEEQQPALAEKRAGAPELRGELRQISADSKVHYHGETSQLVGVLLLVISVRVMLWHT
jgi:hypothetical protein